MNVNVSLDKLFESLKKISPAIVSIGIVSALILFLPDKYLGYIYLDSLPERWLIIISIIFLFSLFVCLTILLRDIGIAIKRSIERKRINKRRKKQYLLLDNDQKQIISYILTNDEKQILLPLEDGNADYLIKMGFIYRPTQQAEIDFNTERLLARYLACPWLITEYLKDPDFFIKNIVVPEEG